jgi:DNA-binding MarR family transcriptional regulator
MFYVEQFDIEHYYWSDLMEHEGVAQGLKALNNLICRYFEFSSHKNEHERITGNNGWIIGYLAERSDGDIFQKDVEEHFSITRSTASSVLSLMEQKGLLERLAVTRDARLKKLVLTEKALEIVKEIGEDVHRLENELLAGFTPSEVEALCAMLDKMQKNISESLDKKGGNSSDA